MEQAIFVSPRSEPHARWIEAFGELRLISELPGLDELEGKTVWLSTDLPAWSQALEQLAQAGVRVVVLSLTPGVAEAARALDLGARGYAHAYCAPVLLQQIASVVAQGGHWVGSELMKQLVVAASKLPATEPVEDRSLLMAALTTREQEVANAVVEGKSNKEIARALDITERTVKAHLAAVFKKLNVRDRLHLALRLAATTTDKLPL